MYRKREKLYNNKLIKLKEHITIFNKSKYYRNLNLNKKNVCSLSFFGFFLQTDRFSTESVSHQHLQIFLDHLLLLFIHNKFL